MKSRGYTEEQISWIKKNVNKFSSYSEMCRRFNEVFSEDKNWKTMHSFLKRHGFIEIKSVNKGITIEQKEFLKEMLPLYTYEETTLRFNKKFSEEKTVKQIQSFCTNNGIKRGVDFPVGSEHRNGKYIMVKVRECEKGVPNHKIWKMKQQVVWEQHYGKIPKGKILIFLDNNSMNCDISNLYLADRKISNLLTVNKWHFDNPDQKLAAIKWCELYFSMGKDIKEENQNKRIYIPMTDEERFHICPVCGKRFEVYQRRKAVCCSVKCSAKLNDGKFLKEYMDNHPKEKHFCKVEGCDRPAHGLGYCDLHYQRYKKTGTPYGVKMITYNSKSDAKIIS